MDNNQESVEIKITHLINPHMFWFSKTTTEDSIQNLEDKINKGFGADLDKLKESFGLNEIVAVKHLIWNRYVRARIINIREFINFEFKYVLWLMDYGFPLESKNVHIRKLPSEYANISTQIQFGSLTNIMPGFACNLGSMGRSAIESKNWSKSTINCVSQLLKEATSITFAPVGNQIFEYQQMGVLKLQLNAKKIINLNDYLINNQLGVECNNFVEKIRKSETNKIEYFLNNERKYKVVKNISIEPENYSETKCKYLKKEIIEPQIKLPVVGEIMNILDSGVNTLSLNENTERPTITAPVEGENCIILDADVEVSKYRNVGQMHKLKWKPVPRVPSKKSFCFDEYIKPQVQKTMDEKSQPSVSQHNSYDNITSHFLNNDQNILPIAIKNNQMGYDSTPKSPKFPVNSSENQENYSAAGNKSLTPESIQRMEQMLKLRSIHRNMYSQKNEKEVESKTCNGQLPSLVLSLPAGFDMRNLHPSRNWESRPKTKYPRKCHDKWIKQK